MTYEEWKLEYVNTLKEFLSFVDGCNENSQSGKGKFLDSVLDPRQRELSEKLGKLVDDYPEYEERFDNEELGKE